MSTLPHKPFQSPDLALLLLRLAAGGLMLFHGVAKLFDGIASIEGVVADRGLPTAFAYGVYVGEVIAPLLLLAGVYGRIGGLILAINMVVTIWLGFPGQYFTLNDHGAPHYELNLFYLVCGLAIFLMGSGRLSLRKGLGSWD